MSREEFKIAVIGAGGAGKSALTIQLIQHDFIKDFDPTIEDSYYLPLSLTDNLVDKTVYLEILDTAGQEEFRALRASYMRSCFGFYIVTDCTDAKSLETIKDYVDEILRIRNTDQFPPAVLVINKIDLKKDRTLSVDQAKEFSKKFLDDCPVFETSAKDRINVTESFTQLVRECRKRVTKKVEPPKKGLFSSSNSTEDAQSDLALYKN
jgi:GTPase KRas protein